MNFEKELELIQSSNINFLIGAGASMPLLNILGPVEKILTDISDLENELAEKLQVSILKYYFDQSISGNLQVLQEEKTIKAQQTLDAYKNFFGVIKQLFNHRAVSLLHKKANIFTTNMDILIEKSLEEINFEYIDGFSGRISSKLDLSNYNKIISKLSLQYDRISEVPIANLFKVHGSVNWKKDSNQITYDYDFKTLNDLSVILFDEREIINPIQDKGSGLKEFKNIDVLKSEAKEFATSDNHKKFKSKYNEFQFINPTKKKFEETTLGYTYYEMLRMLSNSLEKENSILYVIGFSFSDEHLQEILIRALNSNPTMQLCIFPYDEKAKADISQNISFTDLVNDNARFIKFISDEKNKIINYDLQNITQYFFKKILEIATKGRNGN